MKVVLFHGYKGSGKTTAISLVARKLSRMGLHVGTVKHIHDPGFTIDKKGKDTWVHANSGAKLVVALAPNELTIIKKMSTNRIRLDSVLETFKAAAVDYVLVEGLYRKFRRKKDVVRVLCASNEKDALDLLEQHGRADCICGKIRSRRALKLIRGIQVLSLPRDLPKLLHLIDVKNGNK